MTSRLDLIQVYFEACNAGTAAAIGDCFTADAVIYDTNHPAVRGRTAIGAFWSRIRQQWSDATWTIDAGLEDGDTAAIEWSMHGSAKGATLVFRGSEHYRFEGDLIAELRQYWTFDPERLGSRLVDYPYSERGWDGGRDCATRVGAPRRTSQCARARPQSPPRRTPCAKASRRAAPRAAPHPSRGRS